MKVFLLVIIGLGLTGVCAPAQIIEYFHPKPYKSCEGSAKSNLPFGLSTPTKANRQFRWQQIHDNVLPTTTGLNNLAIRRDGATPYDYSWYSVEMEFSLSTCPSKAANASANFANNIGKDVTKMLSRTTVFFPASICRGGMPEYDKVYLPFG